MTVGELNVEIGAKLDNLERALGKMEGEIKGAGKKAENASKTSFGQVASVIAGAFAVDAIINFSRQIISARGEFEKFGAVLTNTLGSKSASQEAIKQITEFAAKTPFAVNELTDAFVKLANQGFKPTRDEMTKLGDLAASTGKSFDQLAEAIIDAQVGEFERLKEFGIRAQKEGDNVTFTFKGVQTQVDLTAESIQDYILGLGDLQGVSGSMAAISETLTGKVSNLGDAWNNLLITIGDSSIYKTAITGLTNIVTAIDEGLKKMDYHKALARDVPALFADGFLDIEGAGVGDWNPLKLMLLDDSGNLRGMDDIEDAIKKNAADLVPILLEAKKKQKDFLDSLADVSGHETGGGIKAVVEATKEQIEAFHQLGTIAYLTSEVMKDAWGSASEVSIAGPMVEMDRLVDPEMEAAMMGIGEQIAILKEKVDSYNESLTIASETGAIFGGVLQSSFEAALISGESFFDVFINGLKNMVSQLIAAAATAAILSAVLSTFMPGLGFGAAFGRVAGGMGGGGALGGIFKLFGTDLVASTGRTNREFGRVN